MLIGRNNYSRSCATKLERGWERKKVQRAAELNDDEGYSKVIGLRLLLLVAAIMAAKAPTNEHTPNDNGTKCRYGAKIIAALRRVKPDGYGAPWYFQPIKT